MSSVCYNISDTEMTFAAQLVDWVRGFALTPSRGLKSLGSNGLYRFESVHARTRLCSINMPQRSRPYFQSSFKELNELFLRSQNDAIALAALLAELQHRDRAPAISLRGDVLRRLNELNDQGTIRENSQPGPDSAKDNRSQPNSESVARATGSSTAGNIRSRSASSQDSNLRRPAHLKQMEPLGVTGRPSKYIRPLKTDVDLPITNEMARAARYAVALGALVAEMRRQRQGMRQIALENGERVALDRGHIGYVFSFAEDADLFEDARVDLQIGARTIEGNIVSIAGGQSLSRSRKTSAKL